MATAMALVTPISSWVGCHTQQVLPMLSPMNQLSGRMLMATGLGTSRPDWKEIVAVTHLEPAVVTALVVLTQTVMAGLIKEIVSHRMRHNGWMQIEMDLETTPKDTKQTNVPTI
jgi:hypothetical protein